ncbi:hypothetical protein NC651_016022 [Populus alba x Populus x berolinensis]|nr:hypothetical protein NC651_016022 [Populus alba x Populus x berolinensis]
MNMEHVSSTDSLSPAFLELGQHQIQTVGFGPTRSGNQNPT